MHGGAARSASAATEQDKRSNNEQDARKGSSRTIHDAIHEKAINMRLAPHGWTHGSTHEWKHGSKQG
jgi:hypothetical protein